MPGDRVTLATVPDLATAELLREVLYDGGISEVEIRSAVGIFNVPRPSSVDFEVRVDDVDEANARLLLADFEAESGQAATSQAATSEAAEIFTPSDDSLPESGRRRWVFWVVVAIVLVWLMPFFGFVRILITRLIS